MRTVGYQDLLVTGRGARHSCSWHDAMRSGRYDLATAAPPPPTTVATASQKAVIDLDSSSEDNSLSSSSDEEFIASPSRKTLFLGSDNEDEDVQTSSDLYDEEADESKRAGRRGKCNNCNRMGKAKQRVKSNFKAVLKAIGINNTRSLTADDADVDDVLEAVEKAKRSISIEDKARAADDSSDSSDDDTRAAKRRRSRSTAATSS